MNVHPDSETSCVAILAHCVVIFSGCKKKDNPFPAIGEIAGWQKTGDTRVFEAKDLWQYIDGDSEQYIKAGVVSTSTSDYNYQSQLEAVVDVHTMGDADGARKILETGATEGCSEHSGRRCRSAYAQSVAFRKGAVRGADRRLSILRRYSAGSAGPGARSRSETLKPRRRTVAATNDYEELRWKAVGNS